MVKKATQAVKTTPFAIQEKGVTLAVID